MRAAKVFVLILSALLLAALPTAAQDAPLITISESDTLGPYLAGANGMTLYVFDRDRLNTSNCANQCAENWPPLTVDSADALSAAEGVPGTLATIEREDGSLQVTYNGLPLYYWARDAAAGDTTGHGVGRVWWVMPPATVYAAGNETLGRFLVGPEGKTLYLFTVDEPGISNCADDCTVAWPPLIVESADAIVPGVNLVGTWGTTERADGTLQVTYNDAPLYYWIADMAPGDSTGQGVEDVWFVVKPESVGITSSDELGDFLTSTNGMTLYTFANDEPGISNCVDQCAENWPPFTIGNAADLTPATGLTGELGTIERADGALQVTYNGWPLYFWHEDVAPGDTNGQGRGDVWFVASVAEA